LTGFHFARGVSSRRSRWSAISSASKCFVQRNCQIPLSDRAKHRYRGTRKAERLFRNDLAGATTKLMDIMDRTGTLLGRYPYSKIGNGSQPLVLVPGLSDPFQDISSSWFTARTIRVRLRSHLCVEGVSHSFVQGEA